MNLVYSQAWPVLAEDNAEATLDTHRVIYDRGILTPSKQLVEAIGDASAVRVHPGLRGDPLLDAPRPLTVPDQPRCPFCRRKDALQNIPRLPLLDRHCLGERTLAERLFELEAPGAGTLVVLGGPGVCWGAVDHSMGLLAETVGDLDGAANHYRAAGRLAESVQSPPFVARALVALAALPGVVTAADRRHLLAAARSNRWVQHKYPVEVLGRATSSA